MHRHTLSTTDGRRGKAYKERTRYWEILEVAGRVLVGVCYVGLSFSSSPELYKTLNKN